MVNSINSKEIGARSSAVIPAEAGIQKPAIVFFGNEHLATGVTTDAPVLRALIEAGYHIEAVIVNHSRATSRNNRVLEVEQLAREHDIPVHAPASKDELVALVSTLSAPIAVLVAYGRIVPQTVIDNFEHGIVNVHPSKLPAYRGSTPLESVLLDGAAETAVSLMQLAAKMDAGPVYAQQDVALEAQETKQQLADKLGKTGADMIIENLEVILSGELEPTPQDKSAATYTKQITKADGALDFTKPAEVLEREIRAYASWPGSSTEIQGKPVTITAASVTSETGTPGQFFVRNKQLGVYCANGALIIDSLKPAGKRQMTAAEFLAGNPLT